MVLDPLREADSSSMISLPSFLEALSSILIQLDDPVSTLSTNVTMLTYVERLVVLLMEQIPYLHEKLHHSCYLAIIRTLLAVKQVQGSVFNAFVSHIGRCRMLYQMNILDELMMIKIIVMTVYNNVICNNKNSSNNVKKHSTCK